jgi:steroid delta-isomerase
MSTSMPMRRRDDPAARHAAALERLALFYETLTPQTVFEVRALYAAGAVFKDPFNETRGHAAIIAIFEHMYVQLETPRFIVVSRMVQGEQAFLTWEMRFRFKRWPQREHTVRGASHLRFDAESRVSLHRDYWDAAEELYEKIPLLGGLMRLLKRAARR